MNNNKLSNTGMLKIASKWLQLLRQGKLAPASFKRLIGRSGADSINSLRPSPVADITKLFPVSATKTPAPLLSNMRVGLQAKVEPVAAKDLYKDTIVNYYKPVKTLDPYHYTNDIINIPAIRASPAIKELDASTVPSVANTIKTKFTPKPNTPESRFLDGLERMAPYAYKKDTHRLWGKRYPGLVSDGSYSPTLRSVLLPTERHAGFPSIARHEFAHGLHYTSPGMYEKDVVGKTYQMLKRYPYLRFGTGKREFQTETAAQLIASGGKSRNAQKYINDYINAADKQIPFKIRANKPYTDDQLSAFKRLSDDSLKLDPTGREATTLLHMHKNYNLPMPQKYTRPELFNPNPYLP
jgi:hypothetical protein